MGILGESSEVTTASPLSEREVLMQYYASNEVLLSTSGVLKVICVPMCIVSCILYWESSGCGAGGAAGAAGALAGATAAVPALLVAGTALRLPLYAPHVFLYTEIVSCAAVGAMLVVTTLLSLPACRGPALYYLHLVLSLASGTVLASAAGAHYAAVLARWDEARGPRREPPRPAVPDHDV